MQSQADRAGMRVGCLRGRVMLVMVMRHRMVPGGSQTGPRTEQNRHDQKYISQALPYRLAVLGRGPGYDVAFGHELSL